MIRITIAFAAILILTIACNNRDELMDSKKESNQESIIIEAEKKQYEKDIDSLGEEIEKLKMSKAQLEQEDLIAEAFIYDILKKSYFDHIIVGTKDLDKSRMFYQNVLGFQIKDRNKHKNGINNFFVEFGDSSEIEIVSIDKPSDQLSANYYEFLNKDQYGFQFGIRTNQMLELRNYFDEINFPYTDFSKNNIYSTLSKKNIDHELPFFFINYSNGHLNSTKQENGCAGISTVWISTKNIRKSVNQFASFGFSLLDRVSVAKLSNKAALIGNDNFKIILIENNKSGLMGITIKTGNLDKVREKINDNLHTELEVFTNTRGKSIYLTPEVTKSIWIEFLEL